MIRRDVVVVGGGAMGSAAAWQLARRGVEVELCERFGPGHARGSSHGSSRIVRLAYSDPFYVELAAAGYDAWAELESESGRELLTWTGVVDHGDRSTVETLAQALRGCGHVIEMLDPAEAAQRWPGLTFDGTVLYHSRGGRVHADRTVETLQEEAIRRGALVRHGVQVEAIVPTASGADVHTTRGVLKAGHVVLAAGAWSAGLIGELPTLTVTREQPAHFKPYDPAIPWPSAIHHQVDAATRAGVSPRGTYTVGCPEGLKVGSHATGPVVEPETVTSEPDEAALRELREYVATWIPGVDPSTAEAEPCLYTMTDNSDFVIDRIGDITVAAGFSGHGFKFTPLIGRIVAELVLDRGRPPVRFGRHRAPGGDNDRPEPARS